jgi:hypothetical protein
VNTCTCPTCQRLLRNDDSPCDYYGRCVEPLAWSIEHNPVLNQVYCPLYSVVPKELRDLIFMYALTDSKAHSFESIVYRNAGRFRMTLNRTRRNDIATDLLRTCRAIYHETWMLPLSLNPYMIYNLGDHARSGMKLLPYPWQLALIQSLDITLQQTMLEGKSPNNLHDHLHGKLSWQPEARHRGVYVAPERYRYKTVSQAQHLSDLSTKFQSCFESFCCMPLEREQGRHFLSHVLGKEFPDSTSLTGPLLPWSSAMRVAQARPIIHLTLRIQSSDWWTWTDSPTSTDPLHHLGLDPTIGDGGRLTRPTSTLMRELANRRRSGDYPDVATGAGEGRDQSQGWAATIGRMPDLRSLELVLETFTEKRDQLEQVVEAAKSWKFPIATSPAELTWDGHVDHSGWSMQASEPGRVINGPGGSNDNWYRKSNAFDVRIIRFIRTRTGQGSR